MKRRDKLGRFSKKVSWRKEFIFVSLAVLVFQGLCLAHFYTEFQPIETVEAKEVEVMSDYEYEHYRAKDVQIEVRYSKEKIEELIVEAFGTQYAVEIAKCESGLDPKIQSHHILSYGREESFGLFQIHAPDWHDKALELGFENYRTDVLENIAMAKYIHSVSGWSAWSCSRMI